MEFILTATTTVLLLYILFLRIQEKRTGVLKRLSTTIEDAQQPLRDYTNALPLCIIVSVITFGIFIFIIQSPKLLTNTIVIFNLFVLVLCGFLVLYPLVYDKIKIKKMIKNNDIKGYEGVLVDYKFHRVAKKRYTYYPVYHIIYNETTMYLLGDKPNRKSKINKIVRVYIDEKNNILFIQY